MNAQTVYMICLGVLTLTVVATGAIYMIEKLRAANLDKRELLSVIYDCLIKKIEKIVNYENQTYVMGCKISSDDGRLTYEESRTALHSAIKNTKDSLSSEEINAIEELFPGYDDIEDIIEILIESVVYENHFSHLTASILDTEDEDDSEDSYDTESKDDVSTNEPSEGTSNIDVASSESNVSINSSNN